MTASSYNHERDHCQYVAEACIVLVEQNATAYLNLQKIALSFNSPTLSVIHQDACLFMQHTKEQFDLVFLDPPFSENHLPNCIALLENTPILAPGGLIYIEAPSELTLDPLLWEQVKLKKAGQVVYGLYRKMSHV